MIQCIIATGLWAFCINELRRECMRERRSRFIMTCYGLSAAMMFTAAGMLWQGYLLGGGK